MCIKILRYFKYNLFFKTLNNFKNKLISKVNYYFYLWVNTYLFFFLQNTILIQSIRLSIIHYKFYNIFRLNINFKSIIHEYLHHYIKL